MQPGHHLLCGWLPVSNAHRQPMGVVHSNGNLGHELLGQLASLTSSTGLIIPLSSVQMTDACCWALPRGSRIR